MREQLPPNPAVVGADVVDGLVLAVQFAHRGDNGDLNLLTSFARVDGTKLAYPSPDAKGPI